MKPSTQKQILAIYNLSTHLGEKPKKYRTCSGANKAIKVLIKRVNEYDNEMNAIAYEVPHLYGF